jgi:KDO2-lipid IV(A) lauroyltransferase
MFIWLMSLFSLEIARTVGKMLGYCAYLGRSRLYYTSQTNLQLCFPELGEAKLQALLKNSLLNTGMTVAESGAVWLWPVERIMAKLVEIEGADLLHDARRDRRGLILIAPHHGNWELMGLYLSTLGKCAQLYQPPKNPALDKLLLHSRSRGSAAMYPANSKGVAAILAALKRGEMCGILPDQVPAPKAGQFAPLFNHNAYTMTLISRLLQKTGARALLTYALREKGGFKIIIRDPDPLIYAEHMQTSLVGLNRTVEIAARDTAEQYQWEYKRFRYQPEGKQEPYIC